MPFRAEREPSASLLEHGGEAEIKQWFHD